jgi:AraC-like DNA-binding protein/ligand-binding sensor protein
MNRYTLNPFHSAGKPVPSTIILRREIEPLLLKAREILKAYEQAVDVVVSVIDQGGHSIEGEEDKHARSFCSICKKYYPASPEAEEFPCTKVHLDGIKASCRYGGVYIYMCNLGFMFWTSPLFSNGRFSGALIAGGVLGITRREAAKKITALSGGMISKACAETLVADVPEKEYEEIKALAQILLVCADQVSKDTEEYSETIKRRDEQRSNFSKQLNLIKIEHTPAAQNHGYSLDKERMLLAALRRGDNETAKKFLNELAETLFLSSPDNFKFIQFRAIELVVLFSREAVSPDTSENTSLLEANNRYLKRIQETQNMEELTDVLHIIIERMAGQIFSFQGVRHASALRKAERYIWENYTRKISLQEIAEASGLSAPYFSTIFKEEMGENLSGYLNRIRVEKAAAMLTETALPLNEISCACGFEDQSWFSKIFKSYSNMSPGKYREQGGIIGPKSREEDPPDGSGEYELYAQTGTPSDLKPPREIPADKDRN